MSTIPASDAATDAAWLREARHLDTVTLRYLAAAHDHDVAEMLDLI